MPPGLIRLKVKTHKWNEKKIYKRRFLDMFPNGVVRKGAFIAKNVVLMPSFVNLGAYVDEGKYDWTLGQSVWILCSNWEKLSYIWRSWNRWSVRANASEPNYN